MALCLLAACTPSAPMPEHHIHAHVLMPLAEFIELNHRAIHEQIPSLDPTASLLTVESTQPMEFDYNDPKGRFDLKYPAIGSPANSTRFMVSRGTRLGLQTLAVKHMEFALSDGATLSERIAEAIRLHEYLQAHGFQPVSYATFAEKAGDVKLTDFRELARHVNEVKVEHIGGMHLFTLHCDELVFDVSLIHQRHSFSENDYTLYMIIREKVLGVES